MKGDTGMWKGWKITGKMGLEGEILGCIYIRRKRDKEEMDKNITLFLPVGTDGHTLLYSITRVRAVWGDKFREDGLGKVLRLG
ncbi:hypothetical protein FE904_00005 [Chryseobacterium indologenes]|uniref:hypothetical protein n=1 Tax=Chryseobacterium indologenes TaxID=253 RepID=UPI001108E67A|nr:hypothetical protein [Chryseobacterium indologenes]TLX27413.1 hypothetical protein FE904_00005 [Chryseobacterium indologenes]